MDNFPFPYAREGQLETISEVIEAIKDPSIVHFSCCNPKVWHRYSNNEFGVNEICKRFHNEFYFYANKTDYYNEIYNSYMK